MLPNRNTCADDTNIFPLVSELCCSNCSNWVDNKVYVFFVFDLLAFYFSLNCSCVYELISIGYSFIIFFVQIATDCQVICVKYAYNHIDVRPTYNK